MARFVVGSVPYLNARPLVRQDEDLRHEVEVLYDVPSKLPALLESKRAQAVLVSSIEALAHPGRSVAADVSISSRGPVLSVRLFSKVPFNRIRRLALDQSSLTSNALAQILLRELHGVCPDSVSHVPDLTQMLQAADAGILIGDKGMQTDSKGLHVLDLGESWTRWTSLPFVWALWVGEADLRPELAGLLLRLRQLGVASLPTIIDEEVHASRWDRQLCTRYLKNVMNYDLTDKHLQGLKEFGRLLVDHGLIKQSFWPKVVQAEATTS